MSEHVPQASPKKKKIIIIFSGFVENEIQVRINAVEDALGVAAIAKTGTPESGVTVELEGIEI